MQKKIGYFISIEGVEGVGKSTAIHFLQQYLGECAVSVVTTREPGGTPIAESIRSVLLSHHSETLCADAELFLMFAARVQNIQHIILPALANGQWVLSDRFTDASFAYQGGGRGIDLSRIAMLEKWVQADLQPDLTILLDAPVGLGLTRIQTRGIKDRIEVEEVEFFERVRQVYLDRAAMEPHRFCVIHALQSLEKVHTALKRCVEPLLQKSLQK